MAWHVEIAAAAKKSLAKIGHAEQARIMRYIRERLTVAPEVFGEELKDNLGGFRRYRIGDYRIICEIQSEKLLVLVVRIGHRKNVYGGH